MGGTGQGGSRPDAEFIAVAESIMDGFATVLAIDAGASVTVHDALARLEAFDSQVDAFRRLSGESRAQFGPGAIPAAVSDAMRAILLACRAQAGEVDQSGGLSSVRVTCGGALDEVLAYVRSGAGGPPRA